VFRTIGKVMSGDVDQYIFSVGAEL
jgi:hypothetical protein